MMRGNTTERRRARMLGALLLCAGILPAFADYNSLGVPDSAYVRRSVETTWLNAPLSTVRAKAPELRVDETGSTFQIRQQEEDDAFVIIVAPESYVTVNYVDYQTNQLLRTAQTTSYPGDGFGSWQLYRNKENGRPQKIVMYFSNNPDVYVQLRADGNKTYADVLVYRGYLCRSVPVAIPFENLYRLSFQELYNLTRTSIPWQNVLVEPGLYRETLFMARAIREKLPSIDYVKDAAYNESGALYSIMSGEPFEREEQDDALNRYDKTLAVTQQKDSSRVTVGAPGFAKWIVDGIVRPVTGKNTRISDLIQPTVTYVATGKRGVLSQEWDLTLNLDWDRNLAAKALSARSVRGSFTYKTGGVDVSLRPFVSMLGKDGKVASAIGYVQDMGYPMEEIKGLLYVLAVTEPSWFFLGAVRHVSPKKADESVFDSTAVFFPYFTDNGVFDCYVFQSGQELSLEQFIAQNPNATVHFERVRATENFFPE